ncbi:MAG: tRNA (adenosine(37)-N6)-threonylcarbamoyltransferase complex ATPase subunit type 1 TsaE, partial [Deltaproteobacteria bacterium]|nr:tRNA (adenosine(37)-N6)-threonylcarbamoyltransferase complex ATPase subunit type 1 TsaE [Deltaproteobacteria bacterium]
MYLSFYNLKVKPFQMSTDPDFLWPGKQHKEALATLKYAVRENKGVLALTGEVGTGKTTLINALVQDLEDDKVAATIYDPSFDVLEFFNVVSAAFKMGKTFESKGQF